MALALSQGPCDLQWHIGAMVVGKGLPVFERTDQPTFSSTRAGCLAVGVAFGSTVVALAVSLQLANRWAWTIPLGVALSWGLAAALVPGSPMAQGLGPVPWQRKVVAAALIVVCVACFAVSLSLPSGSSARPFTIVGAVAAFALLIAYSSLVRRRS